MGAGAFSSVSVEKMITTASMAAAMAKAGKAARKYKTANAGSLSGDLVILWRSA